MAYLRNFVFMLLAATVSFAIGAGTILLLAAMNDRFGPAVAIIAILVPACALAAALVTRLVEAQS